MATLLVFNSRRKAGFLMSASGYSLWISVDGEKAFTLGDERCNAVLLPPGGHVVAAASEFGARIRRNLEVTLKAHERVAVRFIFDEKKYVSSTPLIEALTNPEVAPQFFQATAFPATADDVCRLGQAPVVLPRRREQAPKQDQACTGPLSPDQGRIVFYRTEPKHAGFLQDFVLDRVYFGKVEPSTCYCGDFPPGNHEVHVGAFDTKLSFTLEEAQHVFIRFDFDQALFGKGIYPVHIEEQTARIEVKGIGCGEVR